MCQRQKLGDRRPSQDPPILLVTSHHRDEPDTGAHQQQGQGQENSNSRFLVSPNHCYDNQTMFPDQEAESGRRNSMLQQMQGGRRRSSSLHPPPDVAVCGLPASSPCSYGPEDLFGGEQDLYWRTQDALPRLEHYRQSQTLSRRTPRPTLEELRDPKQIRRRVSLTDAEDEETTEAADQEGVVKFGWIRGVYIRCLLNIWGVMLFLRMGWMVGQAGIGGSILIVLLATFNTVVTTMSMSAICTNGEVKGGGAYYMISRSLGPEFGGVVGMVFFVANTISVSMYIVGAAETVRDLLIVYHAGIVEFPSSTNDVRVSGILLLVLTACVTGVGMAFENKAQMFLLVALLVALLDYFVGACLQPTLMQTAKGFIGWNAKVGIENWGPDYRGGEDFFSVFSIFFPSVIGILAGANISGDLKDPCMAIPKGTLLAIVSTSFSYILIIIWLGLTVVRDASGQVQDVLNGTFRNCSDRACPHGLSNYNQVMEMCSGFGPFIYVGIFAACLSSALASLVGAPRIFQALCRDKIFPALLPLGKGYGVNDDPHRAMALTLLIALLFTVIGDLNTVAPIISNLFNAAHCIINFACFHASYVKAPSFRPSFKYYNKWVSLLCSAFCVAAMFIMSWILALVTCAIVLGLFVYIVKVHPELNWGDSTQGQVFKTALTALGKLDSLGDHVKTFRPSMLVMTGNPGVRPPLVDFANCVTKRLGLMVCGHVIKGDIPLVTRSAITDRNRAWLHRRKVKAFYTLCEAESLAEGTRTMLELVGLGKLRPNILLLGFKGHWLEAEAKDLEDYFDAIHVAFEYGVSISILRVGNGLDYGSYFESFSPESKGPPDCAPGLTVNTSPTGEFSRDTESSECSSGDLSSATVVADGHRVQESQQDGGDVSLGPGFGASALRRMSRVVPDVQARLARFRRLTSLESSRFHPREVPPEVMAQADQFRRKRTQGTIDVWWLYDDGGLTLLLPHVLTTRSAWSSCKLRVFCLSTSDGALDQAQVNITALLTKFRVDFNAVTVISDLSLLPSETSKQSFKELVEKYRNLGGGSLSKADLSSQAERTNRHLRLRELLEIHSKDAELIVMTLPIPRRQSGCPAPLYMAWLETLTRDMPPFLLVRGNQTSVLTFYS